MINLFYEDNFIKNQFHCACRLFSTIRYNLKYYIYIEKIK